MDSRLYEPSIDPVRRLGNIRKPLTQLVTISKGVGERMQEKCRGPKPAFLERNHIHHLMTAL